MFTRLSLRLRIFLFFCLMAGCGAALAGGALFFGWSRAEAATSPAPFITAFFIFAFLNTGLAAGIWLLFDENVAKPIGELAVDLRLSAHADVDRDVDVDAARYLGDLAPAASAVSTTLNSQVMDTAAQIARETERLQSETARLTALLTDIPIAVILANPALQIVLYDGQAASVLGRIAPPRLKAPLTEYFDAECLNVARATVADTGAETAFTLFDLDQTESYPARLKPLEAGAFMITIDADIAIPGAKSTRPLIYDFDVLNADAAGALTDTRLSDACLVAFDTETTGLSPETDDVIQIGAVRILNRRIIEGEVLDVYVDPGRPIPAASSRIHKISDADVAGAPDFAAAGRQFHAFARDAVLVAHNAPFDLAFLRRGEAEMGVEWAHPVLDTVLMSAIIFGITAEHSLDALCGRLGIEIPPDMRHTALGDAYATGQAMVKMIPLLEAGGMTTISDVIAGSKQQDRLLKDMN